MISLYEEGEEDQEEEGFLFWHFFYVEYYIYIDIVYICLWVYASGLVLLYICFCYRMHVRNVEHIFMSVICPYVVISTILYV